MFSIMSVEKWSVVDYLVSESLYKLLDIPEHNLHRVEILQFPLLYLRCLQ